MSTRPEGGDKEKQIREEEDEEEEKGEEREEGENSLQS